MHVFVQKTEIKLVQIMGMIHNSQQGEVQRPVPGVEQQPV